MQEGAAPKVDADMGDAPGRVEKQKITGFAGKIGNLLGESGKGDDGAGYFHGKAVKGGAVHETRAVHARLSGTAGGIRYSDIGTGGLHELAAVRLALFTVTCGDRLAMDQRRQEHKCQYGHKKP